jgi:tetratricopeptide (TPR) repeat protein
MNRQRRAHLGIAATLLLVAFPQVVQAQWPPTKFTNLKVLPGDIPSRDLIDRMGEFTRALGVRCTYCHVGDEGLPLSTYHFADDAKLTKRKARVMMSMVSDINEKYLPTLEGRSTPPAGVRCMTCHHGVAVPRTLQGILVHEYEMGGLDSTIARYRSLRARYYGRAAYDFGSVPLADVASDIAERGHPGDAVALNALNVEMNPESEFARRQYASGALLQAFRQDEPDSAAVMFRELKSRYGDTVFPEFALNQMGYALLGEGNVESAIAVFKLGVESFPESANSYDSLGDAYARHGDRKLAMESYEKALKLSPSDETKRKLEALRRGRKR